MPISRSALWIGAIALLLLPSLMAALGLGISSATEVVVFALACMALNILVGFTGLVSFGHGANDAQKTMGVIAALLLGAGYTTMAEDGKKIGRAHV